MFEDLLPGRKKVILERWFRAIRSVYPEGATDLLSKTGDRFRNPVGFTIRREIETLFDEVVVPGDPDRRRGALDAIISIRAVQECAPSEAVGFIFLLKKVVAEIIDDELREADELRERVEFERRVDALGLEAFDIYMKRREQISDIRVKELARDRDRIVRVMQAMGSLDLDASVGVDEKNDSGTT